MPPMWKKTSLQIKPWLVDYITSDQPRTPAREIQVIEHVEDGVHGEAVKIVTDGEVCMKAVITKQPIKQGKANLAAEASPAKHFRGRDKDTVQGKESNSENRTQPGQWTDRENKKFFSALSGVGTDFTLMSHLFPQRTAEELEEKFKREEKENKLLVDNALHDNVPIDLSLFESSSESEDNGDVGVTDAVRSSLKVKRVENMKNGKEKEATLRTRNKERRKRKAKRKKEIQTSDGSGSEAEETEAGKKMPDMVAKPDSQHLCSSEDSETDWNQALLVVRKYSLEHKPDQQQAKCEFILHIEDFSLWAILDSFSNTTIPFKCMDNVAVRKKSDRLWEEWRVSQEKSQMSSISLTQLLAEMGCADSQQQSHDGDMGTHQKSQELSIDPAPVSSPCPKPGARESLNSHDQHGDYQDPAQQPGCKQSVPRVRLEASFTAADFLIPPRDQKQLDAIKEWDPSFRPPPTPQKDSDSSGSAEDSPRLRSLRSHSGSGVCSPGKVSDKVKHAGTSPERRQLRSQGGVSVSSPRGKGGPIKDCVTSPRRRKLQSQGGISVSSPKEKGKVIKSGLTSPERKKHHFEAGTSVHSPGKDNKNTRGVASPGHRQLRCHGHTGKSSPRIDGDRGNSGSATEMLPRKVTHLATPSKWSGASLRKNEGENDAEDNTSMNNGSVKNSEQTKLSSSNKATGSKKREAHTSPQERPIVPSEFSQTQNTSPSRPNNAEHGTMLTKAGPSTHETDKMCSGQNVGKSPRKRTVCVAHAWTQVSDSLFENLEDKEESAEQQDQSTQVGWSLEHPASQDLPHQTDKQHLSTGTDGHMSSPDWQGRNVTEKGVLRSPHAGQYEVSLVLSSVASQSARPQSVDEKNKDQRESQKGQQREGFHGNLQQDNISEHMVIQSTQKDPEEPLSLHPQFPVSPIQSHQEEEEAYSKRGSKHARSRTDAGFERKEAEGSMEKVIITDAMEEDRLKKLQQSVFAGKEKEILTAEVSDEVNVPVSNGHELVSPGGNCQNEADIEEISKDSSNSQDVTHDKPLGTMCGKKEAPSCREKEGQLKNRKRHRTDDSVNEDHKDPSVISGKEKQSDNDCLVKSKSKKRNRTRNISKRHNRDPSVLFPQGTIKEHDSVVTSKVTGKKKVKLHSDKILMPVEENPCQIVGTVSYIEEPSGSERSMTKAPTSLFGHQATTKSGNKSAEIQNMTLPSKPLSSSSEKVMGLTTPVNSLPCYQPRRPSVSPGSVDQGVSGEQGLLEEPQLEHHGPLTQALLTLTFTPDLLTDVCQYWKDHQ